MFPFYLCRIQTRTLPVWNQLAALESISIGLSCPRKPLPRLDNTLDPTCLDILVPPTWHYLTQILPSTFLIISQSFPTSSFKHVSHLLWTLCLSQHCPKSFPSSLIQTDSRSPTAASEQGDIVTQGPVTVWGNQSPDTAKRGLPPT